MTDDQAGEPVAEAPSGGPVLAAYWRRPLVRVVDGIVVGALTTALLIWWVHPRRSSGQALVGVLGPLVYRVYDALLMQFPQGRTLGERLLRIRGAMPADGSAPPPAAAWTRAAVFALPNVVSCLGQLFSLLDVLWCVWDRPYRQCLHDKAARTVVVAAG